MKMQLFEQKLEFPALRKVPAAAEKQRRALVLDAQSVKSVATPAEQERAAGVAVEIRTLVKGVQEAGLEFRRPMNDFAKQVKRFEEDYIAELTLEQKRLERLLVDFAEQEQRRVEAEERKRHAEFMAAESERARLKLEADEAAAIAAEKGTKKAAKEAAALAAQSAAAESAVQAVIAAPMPEASRASGVGLRRVLRWEVTDVHALYKSRPDFVKLEPKGSAIQACCVPEMPNMPDGLKLWWENTGITNARK